MIGDSLNLSQDTISLRFQREIPDLEELVESRLKFKNPADLVGDKEMPTPEFLGWAIMLGWTQEMIGSLLNLTHQAISQRFEQEIRNCEKLAESKLKLKNPADLIDDPEMPTPELLGWAFLLGWTQEEIGAVDRELKKNECYIHSLHERTL